MGEEAPVLADKEKGEKIKSSPTIENEDEITYE